MSEISKDYKRVGEIRKGDHLCYLLVQRHGNRTYFGYTNNICKRLRQHNGELKGGAKYTSGKGPWILSVLVSGFQTKVEALQFEWMCKHVKKRFGKRQRIQNVFDVCRKQRWTKRSPEFEERDIQIHLLQDADNVSEDDVRGVRAKVLRY